tara:strand:- start:16 stop:780 length:765 start_codon:yes stop_codon:yes gene_type:complete
MKRTLLITALSALVTLPSLAAVSLVHYYELGENMVSNRPQDSAGSLHFSGGKLGATSSSSPSPISGSYSTFNGTNDGVYGTSLAAFATNNFIVELWVIAANTTQTVNLLHTSGADNGSLKIGIQGGNWSSSYHGISWIGAAGGAGQAVTAGTWTHLAVIRDSGTSTLYIDGVAQAGNTTGTPAHNGPTAFHLGVNPNGGVGNWFTGGIDDLKLSTFDPNTDDPVAALSINAVPEPSSTALLGLGGLALLLRRRR